jgi:hypothetical protein
MKKRQDFNRAPDRQRNHRSVDDDMDASCPASVQPDGLFSPVTEEVPLSCKVGLC